MAPQFFHLFDLQSSCDVDLFPCVVTAGTLSSLKPVSSIEAFERGEYHRVPLMIGATEDDGLGKGELELVMS